MAMLARIQPLKQLVNEMLDQFPKSVWRSKTTTFLDPAIGGGQFVAEIERRLRAAGHSDENIKSRVFGFEYSLALIDIAINMNKLVGTYKKMLYEDFFKWDTDMKFDVVVGNPPFQDGTKVGGQNKIYNLICKKAISVLNDNGIISFITPTSVLKKSKRFSLMNYSGVKLVNFTADQFFDVGINICRWVIDKTFKKNTVTIINRDKTRNVQLRNTPIYDFSTVDESFTKLYAALKKVTNSPDKRMFRENNFGDAVSKAKTKEFQHKLYSINKNGDKEIFGYSKRLPFFATHKKIIIPMTKTLTTDSILVDVDDYYVAYLCTTVKSKTEIDNIKSFILSDYFKEHSAKWRKLDGYGFNYALKYLPPFDTSKTWKNNDVQAFLEKFSNVK